VDITMEIGIPIRATKRFENVHGKHFGRILGDISNALDTKEKKPISNSIYHMKQPKKYAISLKTRYKNIKRFMHETFALCSTCYQYRIFFINATK
jgi:hypothetical protein